MFYNYLKQKSFWAAWLILSIIGGVIAYFIIKSKEEDLIQTNVYYAIEFRNDLKHPSIIAVRSSADTANYVSYLKGRSNRVEFRFTDIPQGTELYMINSNPNNNIVKVVVKSISENKFNSTHQEFWIWNKFLSKVPPSTATSPATSPKNPNKPVR